MARNAHVPVIALPLSFFLAFVLAVLPLPQALAYWRPEFVTMVLIFWAMNAPGIMGIWAGFFLGILMDVLFGTPFGVHALVLALVAWMVRLSWRWVTVFSLWQTSGLVLAVVFASLIAKRILLGIVATPPASMLYWLPALGSALLWPTVMMALRRYTLPGR
ncbi:MAG: rod shape-determining protein MreD [Moraxellaceae bacterium]|jgi:rod shape-determining protein MreD|nr:rod shape-determining protein MreD [Moraxellaceae bacterium]